MRPFMDNDFLLTTDTAKSLYHKHAGKMPIVDYHCHIDPRAVYEDLVYDDITQVWLGEDHYKWRAMRSNGVDERFITGRDTTPYEKFEKWAETVPKLIGSPLYHWTHLELKRYFGIEVPLSPGTCREIWETANKRLKTLSVRKIIGQSNVRLICTTDDPADDLHWHQLTREDKSCTVKMLPAFRPEKAINIDKPGFSEYLKKLGRVCNLNIRTIDDVKTALSARIEYFAGMGCKVSDYSMDYPVYEKSGGNPDAALQKALAGEPFDRKQADAYKTELLMFLASQYKRHDMVLQLHCGVVRNTNPRAFAELGPDTGFDAIYGRAESGAVLGALFGALEAADSLPKTIVYSLNPADNAQIDSIIGCFQSRGIAGKLQHGCAWWFNDTRKGMIEQLTGLAECSVLPNFVGMLTDSRSFLSYTRHEYFRRILCELIGGWVENGEYPADMEALGRMVEDISYYNAVKYFGFEME